MRPNIATFAAACLLLASAAPAARADDVDLRSGRTISGKILQEDDKAVTIEWRGGTMTISKVDIREIRRSVAPPAAAPAPAAKPAAPAPSKPAAKAATPQRDAAKTPAPAKQGRSLAERLAYIESMPLAPWTMEDSTECTEANAKSYKVKRSDGSVSMAPALPAEPIGVDALYVLKNAGSGSFVEIRDGQLRMYWHRLWWSERNKCWVAVPPNLEAFQIDSAYSDRLVDDVCRDENARISTFCDRQAIEGVLQLDRKATAAAERHKLRDDCRQAMGSEAAGERLARFHELCVDIVFAREPAAKVAFAAKRREELRALVAFASAK